MKKCVSCGKQFPDEASFCMHCMTQLSPVTEVISMPFKRTERNVLMGLLTTVCLATAVGVVFLLGRVSSIQAHSASVQRTDSCR